MNQILITNQFLNEYDSEKFENIKLNNDKTKKFFIFKFLFIFFAFLSVTFIMFLFFYLYSLFKKENLSNTLIDNYSVYRLYAENANISKENNIVDNNLFGIIEIPKIQIYYPVFSHLDEELLKVSPCKFYGESPNIASNLCIAGHNYNNSLFFSNINLLKNGDQIIIYDNLGNKYIYNVFDNYEVEENNLSPILDFPENEKIVTLITCNNFNNNRIIIKAKQKV